MKKTLLTILAVLSVGTAAAVRADETTTSTLTERNAALFASGGEVRIAQVYYEGRQYRYRRLIGYKTVKVTTYSGGVRYVRYKQKPVYRYYY